MANEVMLTPRGHAKLKNELENLKGPERMRIAEAIREAKAHGDLKENAAYHEAKLNQTRLERRIADLEKALQLAKVVENAHDSGDLAVLGSKVELIDLEFDDELSIELVGSYEADPANDMISISSPLGEALLGRSPGEEVSVTAPGGVQRYRVKAVS